MFSRWSRNETPTGKRAQTLSALRSYKLNCGVLLSTANWSVAGCKEHYCCNGGGVCEGKAESLSPMQTDED
jgi:hypothetical protein